MLSVSVAIFGTGFACCLMVDLRPRLNDQTFLSSTVFVKHRIWWLNAETVFDQILDKEHVKRIITKISLCVSFYRLYMFCLQGWPTIKHVG